MRNRMDLGPLAFKNSKCQVFLCLPICILRDWNSPWHNPWASISWSPRNELLWFWAEILYNRGCFRPMRFSFRNRLQHSWQEIADLAFMLLWSKGSYTLQTTCIKSVDMVPWDCAGCGTANLLPTPHKENIYWKYWKEILVHQGANWLACFDTIFFFNLNASLCSLRETIIIL